MGNANAPDPAEAGFLAALAAAPDDDTARLVYADWLDDRGDPRAELLRVTVGERRHPPAHRSHLLRLLFDPGWVAAAVGPAPARIDPVEPHTAGIDRENPGCIIFLLSRAAWLRTASLGRVPVAEAFHRLVHHFLINLISSCEKGEDTPRHYFDIGVIGYGTDNAGRAEVGTVLSGPHSGRDLVSVVDLYDHPLEIVKRKTQRPQGDGAGGLREPAVETSFPVWYRSTVGLRSTSPMRAGLEYVTRVAARWALEHPGSMPPFVVHLTGGDSTDGDPAAAFERLRTVATADGPLFLLNAVYGDEFGGPVFFPGEPPAATGTTVGRLYSGGSRVPETMRRALEMRRVLTPSGCRALAVNDDLTGFLRLFTVSNPHPPYSSPPPHLW